LIFVAEIPKEKPKKQVWLLLWGCEVSPKYEGLVGEKAPPLPRNVYINLCYCPQKDREHECGIRCKYLWKEPMEVWCYFYVVHKDGSRVEMWREIEQYGVGGGRPGKETERIWRTSCPYWFGSRTVPGAPGGSLEYYKGEPKFIMVKSKMEFEKRVTNCKYGLWRQYLA